MATYSELIGTDSNGFYNGFYNEKVFTPQKKVQTFTILGTIGTKFYLNNSPFPITIVNFLKDGQGIWTQDFKGEFDIDRLIIIAPKSGEYSYNVTITTT